MTFNFRHKLIRLTLMTMFFMSVVGTVPAIAQCQMCKSNLESTMRDGVRKKSGLGINNGIMLLLAMPYTVVMVVGVLWYKNSRYKKLKRLRAD